MYHIFSLDFCVCSSACRINFYLFFRSRYRFQGAFFDHPDLHSVPFLIKYLSNGQDYSFHQHTHGSGRKLQIYKIGPPGRPSTREIALTQASLFLSFKILLPKWEMDGQVQSQWKSCLCFPSSLHGRNTHPLHPRYPWSSLSRPAQLKALPRMSGSSSQFS